MRIAITMPKHNIIAINTARRRFSEEECHHNGGLWRFSEDLCILFIGTIFELQCWFLEEWSNITVHGNFLHSSLSYILTWIMLDKPGKFTPIFGKPKTEVHPKSHPTQSNPVWDWSVIRKLEQIRDHTNNAASCSAWVCIYRKICTNIQPQNQCHQITVIHLKQIMRQTYPKLTHNSKPAFRTKVIHFKQILRFRVV
jgi:hypothetical protein